MRCPRLRSIRKRWVSLTIALLLVLGLVQVAFQIQESAELAEAARSITRNAGAVTPKDQVIALRDYIRRTVTFKGVRPDENRPFLRASAGETLRSGKGYCGEVSRAFICLCSSLGIESHRINLYGKKTHVVAEVNLGPSQAFLVDCQNPPTIPDLESLDRVMLRDDFDDYSTLNLRRLGVGSQTVRIKLRIAWLTYVTENPHALLAAFFFTCATGLVVLKIARHSARLILRWRGWIHKSDTAALSRALGIGSELPANAAQKTSNEDVFKGVPVARKPSDSGSLQLN